MQSRFGRAFSVASCVALMTVLAGWDSPARATPVVEISHAVARFAEVGVSGTPLPPKPFAIPAQPIVAASSDGYLPSSWSVTPKGEFTLSLPLAVPPGRAGMAPALSLDYSSGTGDGIAGVGWSVAGFSTITRGGRVWARHGATDGADFSERDRFYLDGQELVGVNATPYGGNGAEYRTEPDTFVRVRSTSAQPLDAQGPELFTVELGDGRTRTYSPVVAQKIVFDDDNKVFAHGPVRVAWRIASEQDASGNTVSYEYEDFSGLDGANASDYWYDERPSKIFYTANLTKGAPTHGLQDLAQRYVKFEYEDRPDKTSGWLSGVQRHHDTRLKALRMYAPNPTATAEVWHYDLSYTMSASQRSTLSAVQRCESAGGCLWAKQFSYSPGVAGVGFASQPVVPAPIPKTTYDLALPGAADGEVPAMQVLDLNADGASDVLFGTGANQLWEQEYLPAPFDRWVSDGKFLGGGHSLFLSQRDANGEIVPLSDGYSIPRDEEPLAAAKYGHVRLDEATSVDLDGDGKDELVAAIDNLGAHEINLDPNLPPSYDCSFVDLKWTGSEFVHTHTEPCTLLGNTNGSYKYYLPNEFPTFADFNGDGLVDRATPYNTAGWVGSNNPNDTAVQYEFSPAWQVAFNSTGIPGIFGAPTKYDQWEASPGVITDLNGDGRPELTNEALKSSLTFDDDGEWVKQAPDSVHLPLEANSEPVEGYREFGDFNGDGLEDMLRLTRLDLFRPDLLMGQIFWNTGQGFYPDSHGNQMSVDVHPDYLDKLLPTRYSNPGIHVTDVNNDGRMDVVIFNNDQPAPQIEFFLSKGDGTFDFLGLPVNQPGTRNDVKYWLDNALRPITFYPDRLENDQKRIVLEAFGQLIPFTQILLQAVPYQDFVVVGGDNKTPGLASGWNLSTLADFNGDGFIDIVRHVGGNDPSGGFQILQQTPQWGDELIAVTDEATAWPALSVDYSSEWSDRPEVNDSYQCTYPLACPKSGLRVVRAVTSRSGLTDLKIFDDPLKMGHTWEYSYRDPIANVQGLGFFGFSEFRMWDTEPNHPVETITTFDLRTPDASGKFYPGVGVPETVTVAQPILQPGQGQPASAPARLTKTTFTYELRSLNNGLTHAVFPKFTHTSAWEEPVAIAWHGGPDHLHIASYAEPADPPIHVDAQMTVDDYGNVTDLVTQTAKGLKTEVSKPTINDTVNWHLGLVSERTAMTLENQKNANPVYRTTAYTYTSQGQLETITVEPNNPDPSIPATTTLNYDDYGLLTSTTTTVANEVPRTQHLEYATVWPGAPDEHLSASALWAEHDDPACVVDCRPAAWALKHPAYGLPIATMDRNGVQIIDIYDAHGRPVSRQTDGALPVNLTYSGRGDSFGGMNGIQLTASSGLQQVLRTFNARGAPLLNWGVGFDGQWIHTALRYDALGRRVAVSRPSTGVPTAWTTEAYDSLGRVVETTYPDSSHSTSTYSLLESEQIDAGGHNSYQVYDVDGRLITSSSKLPPAPGCSGICIAQNIKTTYQYSATPTGAVAIAVDDQGHATQTQYDRRGRPVQQDEPSRGTTKATYNGFGETKQSVHVASGQTETHTYDDLGRVVTMTSADGLTTYTWDIAVNGVGQLARAMSPDQIQTAYRYDSLGRTIGMDQTDEQSMTASLDFQYDPQTGRLAAIDYPQAPGQVARLRIAYEYNGYGYLKTVRDATPNQPPQILQQIVARNADLALVDAERGGGAIADHRDYDPLMGRLWAISASHAGANLLDVSYNYDADGLVNQRTTTDEAVQIDETFEHDALHRLTHSTRNGMPLHSGLPFSSSVDETYDSVGNRVDTLRSGQLTEHRSYGSNGLQPYTLTQRDVSDPANPNQPPQVLQYTYDELGRLKKDPTRSLAWTAFDLPKSVTENGQVWTFLYGPANERVKKKGPDGTTTYLAGLYQKHEDGPIREHVFHVIGSEGPVAEVTYTAAGGGTTQVRYPLTDALGSTNAVADANGTVGEHDYYDSWGLRSNPDGTPLANLPLFHSLLHAGFTNQEHDDAFTLINMQGRLYDPTLGRFLSPDPLVSNPVFSQSWNAYSYVLNSPLNFTDPSGFDCTAAGAVATGSEKGFIATGNCSSSSTSNGNETSGGEGGSTMDGSNAGAAAVSAVNSTMAAMQDLKRMAEQEHKLEVALGRALEDGTPIRSPDGTPIPSRRIDQTRGNAVVTNWGLRVRGKDAARPKPQQSLPANTDGPLARAAANFAVRLGCGSKCASASAPTSARQAAQAPKQLSNPQIARNAVSQALAARSVVKFLGKVGVLIDEGVDGIIERLMPDGMGMTPDDPNDKDLKWARALAKAAAHERYALALERGREAVRILGIRNTDYLNAYVDLNDTNSMFSYELRSSILLDASIEYELASQALDAANAEIDDTWADLQSFGED